MKVKELIKLLKIYNPEAKVTYNDMGCNADVNIIEVQDKGTKDELVFLTER